MTILSKLATSLDRKDETPNIELAKQIAKSKDKKAVQELIDNLQHKNKSIAHDCIKVIYETGEREPSLIAPHYKVFVALLDHKDNRLQWGAMTTLNSITIESPKEIYSQLSTILQAADNGSVITKDQAVEILIKLAGQKKYSASSLDLLHEQMLKSLPNQLPMYAEKALPVIDEKNRGRFAKVLTGRLKDMEKESKRKRVEKVIQKLSKSL